MRQSKNRKHTSEEEYDITRSMLKTIRRSLNEEVEDGIYKVPEEQVRAEQLKFVDSVSKRVDFNELKVYVTGNGNVEWSGTNTTIWFGVEIHFRIINWVFI